MVAGSVRQALGADVQNVGLLPRADPTLRLAVKKKAPVGKTGLVENEIALTDPEILTMMHIFIHKYLNVFGRLKTTNGSMGKSLLASQQSKRLTTGLWVKQTASSRTSMQETKRSLTRSPNFVLNLLSSKHS